LGSHLVEHDAAMLQTNGKFYLVFKDERPEPLKKFIKLAEGPTVEGPWSKISEEFTESWSEGPSALQVGDEYILYHRRRTCRTGLRSMAKSVSLRAGPATTPRFQADR